MNIHHNDNVIIALGRCVTTGCNVNGQLGYHRNHQETQPGVVEALGQNVTMVTCGDSYTAAVTKGINCMYSEIITSYSSAYKPKTEARQVAAIEIL